MKRPESVFVAPTSTLRSVMGTLDATGKGIALVVDDARHLLATITDGDLRRALLAGADLDAPIGPLARARTSKRRSITARTGTRESEQLRTMLEFGIRHVPVVDQEGRVTGLTLLEDLVTDDEPAFQAVVMAGGFGTRLRPLTDDLPKPMLPVGDRPLLERIVRQLRHAGVRHVSLTTHYLGQMISDHFKDGSAFDLRIDYIEEDHPLGTAGALARVEAKGDPVLVMNGDILTRVDFRALLAFHREEGAALTLAVRPHEITIPYGVVATRGSHVTGLEEKPTLRHFIAAGIYLVEPDVLGLVPKDRASDMPELIQQLLQRGRRVVSFPITEEWLDIGQVADYERARSRADDDAAADAAI